MIKTSQIQKQVQNQHTYFRSGETRPVEFRIAQLKKLKQVLKNNEELFYEALEADFSKPKLETYGSELGLLYEEIDLYVKKLPSWASRKKVSGALVNFPSRNYIYPQPYGVSLVIGAWNYPILLALHPVVSAIGAGNTVVLKPSELAPHTADLLNNIVSTNFAPEFFTVVEGEEDTAKALLEQTFDYIFFTGSTQAGKVVMQAAAKQLTPVTLELGAKSPAIIDQTADLKTASKRIAWGKYVNAGQTCVAPDYLLVDASVKDQVLSHLDSAITEFYGDDPAESPDYARIINKRHFDRLTGYLHDGTVVSGGQTDVQTRYIAPTILDNIEWDDQVMQDEIFGPILPVLPFQSYDDIIRKINDLPTPLSLYLFSSDKDIQERVIEQVEFGGGCVNDTMTHLGNPDLPFGGKGESGMGTYHGKAGFDTFSYQKSIMKKPFWPDFPFRYAPYGDKLKWIKRLFN